MEDIRLALFLIVMVGSVMLATRPVSARRRSDRSKGRERSRKSSDPLSRSAFQFGTRRIIDRNRWDRRDLARGIGGDQLDPDGTTTIWPEIIGCEPLAAAS